MNGGGDSHGQGLREVVLWCIGHGELMATSVDGGDGGHTESPLITGVLLLLVRAQIWPIFSPVLDTNPLRSPSSCSSRETAAWSGGETEAGRAEQSWPRHRGPWGCEKNCELWSFPVSKVGLASPGPAVTHSSAASNPRKAHMDTKTRSRCGGRRHDVNRG